MNTYCFAVETNERDTLGWIRVLWIGGPLKPDKKDRAYVWLTRPNGEPILRAKRTAVTPMTREQLATAMAEEAKLRASPKNN